MKILETLIPRWESQNVGPLPGRTARDIKRAFSGRCAGATSDVIQLYSAIGGMQDMENDAYWRLWSLEEIVERNTDASLYGVMFSDHLIDSWSFRVKPETPERSSVYTDYGDSKILPVKLFNGLEEFFLAYARKPWDII